MRRTPLSLTLAGLLTATLAVGDRANLQASEKKSALEKYGPLLKTAARTVSGVADVMILESDGGEQLILLFAGGDCSAETSQELQSRLQTKLDSEDLDYRLSPHECRRLRASAGNRTGVSNPVVQRYAVALFSGTVEELSAAAVGVSGVFSAEVTQKGGTSLSLDLVVSGPCSDDKAADLAERIKLAAAEREVEVTLSPRECWRVVTPASDQPTMQAIERIQTFGLLGQPA